MDLVARVRAAQLAARRTPLAADPLDTRMLRTLIEDLRSAIDERSDELLGCEAVDISMRLWLPDSTVAHVAASLNAIDRAWRLAQLAAAPGPLDLPSSPTVSLDELLPPHAHGLVLAEAEVGSFGAVFHKVAASARDATAILAMIASLYGAGTKVMGVAGTWHGDDASRQVQVAPLPQPLDKTIRDGLGSLPAGSKAEIVIDGETVKVTIGRI